MTSSSSMPRATVREDSFPDNLDLDMADMNAAAAEYETDASPPSDEANGFLEEGRRVFAQITKTKKLKMKTKLVIGRVADSGDSLVASTKCTIHAPASLILAYLMGVHSRTRSTLRSKSILDEYTESSELHCKKGFAVFHAPYPLKDREAPGAMCWEKTSGGYFYCNTCCELQSRPRSHEFVRMTATRAFRLTSPADLSTTTVEMALCLDLGGFIPKRVSNAIVIPQSTSTSMNMLMFFAHCRATDDYNEAGANELGQIIMFKVKSSHNHNIALNTFIDRTTVLRIAHVKYDWLDELLFHVIKNKVSIPSISKLPPLASFSREDARKAGRSMGVLLLSNASSEAAVDEFILAVPALAEFAAEFRWFRPFMNAVTREVMSGATLGLVFRAYSGAALSFLDTVSDVYMIVLYFRSGRTAYAWIMVFMISLNISMTILMSFIQRRKHPKRWSLLAVDVLWIVTFVKPGVAAYRVVATDTR